MTACNVADGLQRDISNLQLYVYRVFDVREVQELEHSDRDTDSFFKVMWKGLRDVLQVSVTSQMSSALGARGGQGGGIADNSLSGVEFVNHLIKSIRRVKETKRLMKEIWEQVGLSVQGRLDVYILWLQTGTRLLPLVVCAGSSGCVHFVVTAFFCSHHLQYVAEQGLQDIRPSAHDRDPDPAATQERWRFSIPGQEHVFFHCKEWEDGHAEHPPVLLHEEASNTFGHAEHPSVPLHEEASGIF